MIKETLALMACVSLGLSPVCVKAEPPLTTARMAEICSMTEEEFIFISSVVEAESDRSDSLEGRVLIAEVILNRVNDSRFQDTISEVLNQSGQFSTVRNGHSVTQRTELSDQAVIEAFELNQREDSPEVLFFNCRGFFSWRPAYQQIGGNYFSL